MHASHIRMYFLPESFEKQSNANKISLKILYIIFVRSILNALLGVVTNANPQYIHVNILWSIFQLPSIQRVSVSDFKPHQGASQAEYAEDFGDIFEASTVTDLNLVLQVDSDPCLGTPDSFILFSLPKRLTRLSVYLKGSWSPTSTISNTDVWNGIRPYEGTIESLDIERSDYGRETDLSNFGSLRGSSAWSAFISSQNFSVTKIVWATSYRRTVSR